MSNSKKCSEAYSELRQTPKMEHVAKNNNGFQKLIIFAKSSMVHVSQGYASVVL